VAKDVEKVNPDLVLRDADSEPETVRDEQINAMLLNRFFGVAAIPQLGFFASFRTANGIINPTRKKKGTSRGKRCPHGQWRSLLFCDDRCVDRRQRAGPVNNLPPDPSFQPPYLWRSETDAVLGSVAPRAVFRKNPGLPRAEIASQFRRSNFPFNKSPDFTQYISEQALLKPLDQSFSCQKDEG
jgi:hypothetical protein